MGKPKCQTDPDRPLTAKQQRFIEEYLVDLNQTAAARRAGYSARSADAIARETLANPRVAAAIAAARTKLSEETGRTVADVMADLRRVGKKAEQVGEHGAAIRALELEAKHLGAFTDRVQLSGDAALSLAVTFAKPEVKPDA